MLGTEMIPTRNGACFLPAKVIDPGIKTTRTPGKVQGRAQTQTADEALELSRAVRLSGMRDAS